VKSYLVSGGNFEAFRFFNLKIEDDRQSIDQSINKHICLNITATVAGFKKTNTLVRHKTR